MVLKILGHGKALQLFLAKDLCHFCIGSEVALVVWVLKVVLLQVGPKPLGDLGSRQLQPIKAQYLLIRPIRITALFVSSSTSQNVPTCSPGLASQMSASSALKLRGFINPLALDILAILI